MSPASALAANRSRLVTRDERETSRLGEHVDNGRPSLAWLADRYSLSPNTVAKAYRLLREVLDGACDAGLIARNPCTVKGAESRSWIASACLGGSSTP